MARQYQMTLPPDQRERLETLRNVLDALRADPCDFDALDHLTGAFADWARVRHLPENAKVAFVFEAAQSLGDAILQGEAIAEEDADVIFENINEMLSDKDVADAATEADDMGEDSSTAPVATVAKKTLPNEALSVPPLGNMPESQKKQPPQKSQTSIFQLFEFEKAKPAPPSPADAFGDDANPADEADGPQSQIEAMALSSPEIDTSDSEALVETIEVIFDSPAAPPPPQIPVPGEQIVVSQPTDASDDESSPDEDVDMTLADLVALAEAKEEEEAEIGKAEVSVPASDSLEPLDDESSTEAIEDAGMTLADLVALAEAEEEEETEAVEAESSDATTNPLAPTLDASEVTDLGTVEVFVQELSTEGKGGEILAERALPPDASTVDTEETAPGSDVFCGISIEALACQGTTLADLVAIAESREQADRGAVEEMPEAASLDVRADEPTPDLPKKIPEPSSVSEPMATATSSAEEAESVAFEKEVLEEFVAESQEALDGMDRDLVALEATPDSMDLLASIFRYVHNTKGMAGLLGLPRLSAVLHEGEELLGLLQEEKRSVDREEIALLLEVGDVIRHNLRHLRDTGCESETDHAELLDRLSRRQHESSATMAPPAQSGMDLEDVPESFVTPARDAAEEADLLPAGMAEEMLKEFIHETGEAMDGLEQAFVDLEREHGSDTILFTIMRLLHNTKGMAGMLNLPRIGAIAHEGESVVELLRESRTDVSSIDVNLLLRAGDAIRHHLSHLLNEGEEAPETSEALLASLRGEAEKLRGILAAATTTELPAPPESLPEQTPEEETLSPDPEGRATRPEDRQPPVRRRRRKRRINAVASEQPTAESPATESSPPRERRTTVHVAKNDEAVGRRKGKNTRTILADAMAEGPVKVDVRLLDSMMSLMGELVLARNRLLVANKRNDTDNAAKAAKQIDTITSRLQRRMVRTRMQKIGQVWKRYPRMVRDLAHRSGKEAQLLLEGEATELDRTLVEALRDPLTHLIRNAVDHGVESPEVRQAVGKAAEGTIALRAYPEAGMVNIEIADDGAGLDYGRIRRKAVERRLVSASEAEELSEQALTEFLFHSGFSTATRVTDISGRGVGMDVVKTNIERIGGMLRIDSKPGRGTTMRLRVPLTLAIRTALFVSVGAERFAIPQSTIVEVVRLRGEQVDTAFERVAGKPVYRLRDQLLPVLFLREALSLPPVAEAAVPSHKRRANIVVLRAGDGIFGLVVDKTHDMQEIVEKPLGRHLASIPFYSGGCILGDGSVNLVLDTVGLAAVGATLSDASRTDRIDREPPTPDETFLLFDSLDRQTFALPVDAVKHLAPCDSQGIQEVGGRYVVRFRDSIVPLAPAEIAFSEALRISPDMIQASRPEEDNRRIVYIDSADGEVALLVGEVRDIVRQPVEATGRALRSGVSGAILLNGRVTEVLDTRLLLRRAGQAIPDEAVASAEGLS